MLKFRKWNLLFHLFAMSSLVSCKKSYLETKPSNAITPDAAYGTIAALNSAVSATYLTAFDYSPASGGGAMHDAYGQKSIDLANDLMGNDMVVHSQGYGWYNADYNYTAWQRPVGNGTRSSITWNFYYDLIKQANIANDNLKNITLTSEQQTYIGEFIAIRAWAYFGLINNFQHTYRGNESLKGVPVYESLGAAKGRGTVQDVYSQIIKDLDVAERLLDGKPKRLRPDEKRKIDVSVVRGFRARVALVMEDYTTAAIYANKARKDYPLMTNSLYQSRGGFSKIDNPEWMWGSYIPESQSTFYASFYSHMDATILGYAQLGGQKKITKDLYDRIPEGDIRKKLFVQPGTGTPPLVDYTQKKFSLPNPAAPGSAQNWAADYLYMRAAEMYLIEAESLARLGRDLEAKPILEELVKIRYPAYSVATLSGKELVDEILLQRRIELWGEGFSLFDIKRTKSGLNRPTGLGNHGGTNLNPIQYILPDKSPLFLMRIPQRELDNNPSMTPGDQNP